MSKKKGLGKLLAGVAIGAGLGVLFAPKKGSETRNDLLNKFEELKSKAQDIDIDEVKETIDAKIELIKNELADLDKEKVMALAKEQADHIKSKCDDLVAYAINYGTPVLEKTAEVARTKAVEILKATLDKLEKTENTKKKNR